MSPRRTSPVAMASTRRAKGQGPRREPPCVTTYDGMGAYSPVTRSESDCSASSSRSRFATAARIFPALSRTAVMASVDGFDWTHRTWAPSSLTAAFGLPSNGASASDSAAADW